jgi:hypothetical protein
MRAQTSFEFMVVLAALLMLFMIVFSISIGGSGNLLQARETVSAQRNAYAAAAAMNFVYLAGDGARYNLTLGSVADGENITISDYSVTSMRDTVSAGAPLLDGRSDASALSRGEFQISNEGGEVHVSPR